MTTYTHKIISMERAVTGGSKSPMWRCLTEDGEKVNVFQHQMTERDTAHLFDEAGYWPFMGPMQPGDELTWNEFPIPVAMQKQGEWWVITAVAACEDTRPDERLLPDHARYQEAVIRWAGSVLRMPNLVIWDTETTGLSTKEDEIISFGAVKPSGEVVLDMIVRPIYLERVERVERVNGFTRADLEDTPDLLDAWQTIHKALAWSSWAVYNAGYDSEILEFNCRRHCIQPIFPNATVDVMEMFARFYGDYDQQRQAFKPKTLSFAAEYFGIEQQAAHSALEDAQTTLRVIQALANAEAAI